MTGRTPAPAGPPGPADLSPGPVNVSPLTAVFDEVSGREAGGGAVWVRAGVFAVLGTVLALLGHHAIAEAAVPWRLAGALVAVQLAAFLPLARRRPSPVVTLGATLVTQGALHLALSSADGHAPAALPGHAGHAGHPAAAGGDGHAWHHGGVPMAAVHTAAALAVAWLLHRADVRTQAALGLLRTLGRAAAAALAQVLPRPVPRPEAVRPRAPGRRSGAFLAPARPGRADVLEHAVGRRGPPRRENPPVLHRPRSSPGRILPFPQGVPPCPCPTPSAPWRAPAAVSASPAPSP
ncbi:hypothetical protein [Streptomyces phaeofaciens]